MAERSKGLFESDGIDVGGGVVAESSSRDGARMARARRALAMAEALACSGMGARLLSEDVSQDGPRASPRESLREETGEEAPRDPRDDEREDVREDEDDAPRSQTVPGRLRRDKGVPCAAVSRPRRGKKQRVQQCARDVKRFLARRDAGVPLRVCVDAGAEGVGEFDARWPRTTEATGLHARAAMLPAECGADGAAASGLSAFALSTSVLPTSVLPTSGVPTLRIPLDDATCDAALGGGLACGALHEIQGVSFAGEPSFGLACPPDGRENEVVRDEDAWNKDAWNKDAWNKDAWSKDAWNKDAWSKDAWIVPFGCLLHIVRKAVMHPALADRSVAWIGDRVHPPRHMLRVMRHGRGAASLGVGRERPEGPHPFLDEELERRSVFVGDVPHGAVRGDRLAGEGAACPTPSKRGRAANRVDDRVRARLWCTELAIRLGAAGVIVVDGSGFDRLAWRRLQLVASAAQQGARACVEAGGGESSSGPLVLVVTPPADEGAGAADGTAAVHRLPRAPRPAHRLRTAATQWSVSAERAFGAADSGGKPDRRGCGDPFRFRWRMQLTHMRSGFRVEDAAGTATHGIPRHDDAAPHDSSSVHAAIADRSLSLPIELPRTACSDDAWNALRDRTEALHGRGLDGCEPASAPHKLQDRRIAMQLKTGAESDQFPRSLHDIHRLGWEVRSA